MAGSGASSEGGSSGSTGVDTKGFTISGDIDMAGNKIIGFDSPSVDSSAVSKKYVDDEVSKVTTVGGILQAQADATYLKKTDATTTYETQTSASNTYLSKTDTTTMYALIGSSYTKVESDAKYATTASRGLSASGFTMSGDIDMGDHEIKRLSTPTRIHPQQTNIMWIITFLVVMVVLFWEMSL